MDIFTYLKGKIDEDIEAIKDDMAAGRAQDLPQYRQQVGLIGGLRRAYDLIREAEKNNSNDEDNDFE